MAQKVTFDPINKIIDVVLAPVDGSVDLDFKQDVYSDGKEDWILSGSLNKLRFPLRGVGGDSISDVKDLGSTFFLLYGWKIRPYAGTHRLLINGNVFTDPSGESVITPATGSYNITVEMFVSNLTDSTLAQLSQIEYASFNNGITVNISNGSSGTDFPIGTPVQPVNNLVDAQTIAASRGFSTYFIIGNITIDSGLDFETQIFMGESPTKSTIFVSASANVHDCEFYDCTISGTLDGDSLIKDSIIEGLDDANGIFESCLLHETPIKISGSSVAHFLDCWSGVAGTDTPTIDCGGTTPMLIRNYSGGIKLINKTGPEEISLDLNSGQVKLSNTITSGTIVVRGIGEIIEDFSTGSAIINSNGLISNDSVTLSIWSESVALYPSNSAGNILANVSASSGATPADIADAVWDENTTSHTSQDTFGGSIVSQSVDTELILGLVQHNFRMTNHIYDANGNMTSCEINIYRSSADATTQTNPINTYFITAVYDGDNRLIDYKMVE